jgi:3-hydroxy acid dehydrogenase / malonic semialdehyde reductase
MSKKWAVITGASSGIGLATARLLSNSWNLVLIARRQDRLAELVTELPTECLPLPMDVQNHQEVAQLIKAHEDVFSQVELLVNNAGLAKGIEKMQDANVEDWQTMMNTNVMGLLYLTREVLPKMLKNKKGLIVNVGSVAGRWVYPGGAVYCASKFAVRAISEGLRMDLLGTPIRVTNIEPGLVETEFSKVRLQNDLKARAVYQGVDCLQPEDIAETILWCVDRPAHVNIQELVIFPTDQAAVGQLHRR